MVSHPKLMPCTMQRQVGWFQDAKKASCGVEWLLVSCKFAPCSVSQKSPEPCRVLRQSVHLLQSSIISSVKTKDSRSQIGLLELTSHPRRGDAQSETSLSPQSLMFSRSLLPG